MNENASCLLKHGGTGRVLRITPWARNALQLLADGHTRNELSRHLGASAAEIDSLLEELFAAMGVATHAEAVAAAHKRGLLKEGSLAVLDRRGGGARACPHALLSGGRTRTHEHRARRCR
jgi:DNA-binding CsgD family transcriptional regulator